MATKKKKQRKKKRSGGGGTPPPRRRDGTKALKGMAIGGLFFLLMTIFFFVRIGSETPFNHLVNLVMGEATVEGKDPKKSKAKVTTAKAKPGAKASAKAVPSIANSAETSPPLEKLTEKDKADLDKLIRARTQ